VSGGVMVLHDARIFPGGWTHPASGSVRAVTELFEDGKMPNWTIVDEVDSTIVVRRT
jgi:hypothetical protein